MALSEGKRQPSLTRLLTHKISLYLVYRIVFYLLFTSSVYQIDSIVSTTQRLYP